ncbi:hypothetical protein [Candidatus Parabeggiatoa sp. HSG14]|uniref:hypothetical protein n=1 Tax=Candidatus Parabeggiatoa sp. HSG14 TaxID=3055593 RepID=UPI0025A86260|nr:hypothetical protein [Thiotrichales bacterium HSG14]
MRIYQLKESSNDFFIPNGLIWISINIEYEGKYTRIDNCILDTGAATTAIDIDLVDFNFKKRSIIKRLHGIGDGIQIFLGILRQPTYMPGRYKTMNQERVIQDITTLPLVAQQEVIDFIAFLKLRYSQSSVQRNSNNLSTIENEPFIGMWQNHPDMDDSTTWVRSLRQREWG